MNNNRTNPDWKWRIAGLSIPIIITTASIIGGWYTFKAKIVQVEEKIVKMEKEQESQEDKIIKSMLNDVNTTQEMRMISGTLNEIKEQTKVLPQIQQDIAVLKEKVK